MAKKQNVHLDRQQAKSKKQKRMLFVLLGVLGLALVYEVPHTMKLMHHSAAAPVVEAAGTPPASTPTTTPTPPPAAASVNAPAPAVSTTPSLVASVTPAADPGQLTQFARFASKDPFDPKIQDSAGAPAAPASPGGGSKTGQTPSTPKAPPAPPPGSAVISVNGELMSVQVNSDFPTSGTVFNQVGSPLFHLISLTQKTAKVAIAGGSYADGSAALTLTVGKPVTLQNTADGTRYTLLLEPQGTPVPVTTTPGSTTPTITTSGSSSVVPSSGG